MPRIKAPVVVTANALLSGEVVYLDNEGLWQPAFAVAKVFDALESAEAALLGAACDSLVLGAYLAEVSTGSSVRPKHYREGFRERGPSNYEHGKQASQQSGGRP